jgi:23S rRNA (cytosine1962-C5)-methyltransferase
LGAQAAARAFDPARLGDLIFDAAMKRAKIANVSQAYRLINGEPDGLPGCTVDIYGAYACINPYDEVYDQPTFAAMAHSLAELGYLGVYVKQRVRADLRKKDPGALAPDFPVLGERAPDRFSISEHGMQMGIELHEGLSTGLFVDMRACREKVRGFAQANAATRMLNLFCYTCSFSVAAALGGAVTTSVDLSGRALMRGRLNFELNGLDPAGHRFFKEDALKYLKKAVRRGDQFELVVLDPPSFATVGKSTFSIGGHYRQSAQDCFSLLAPGGRLLCVTNHLKTSPRQFIQMVEEAAREAGRSLASLRSMKSPLDCPDHAAGPSPSKAVLATVI